MRGKRELDLSINPPPTLAIEVDNTDNTEIAWSTYARIGVPEVWQYDIDSHRLWFGLLEGDEYREVDRSRGLPRLTVALVLEALESRKRREDDLHWLDWLDAWARSLPEPN